MAEAGELAEAVGQLFDDVIVEGEGLEVGEAAEGLGECFYFFIGAVEEVAIEDECLEVGEVADFGGKGDDIVETEIERLEVNELG